MPNLFSVVRQTVLSACARKNNGQTVAISPFE